MKKLTVLVVSFLILIVWQCASSPDASVGSLGETTRGPLGTLNWGLGAEVPQGGAEEPPHEESEVTLSAGAEGGFGLSTFGDTQITQTGVNASGGVGYVEEMEVDRRGFRYLPAVGGRRSKTESAGSDGQNATWRRAGAAANATTLRIGDEDELPLLGIEAAAWVDGIRARVLLDCLYKNDREQQLEGSFKLRLPEGATPYYLAFGQEVLVNDRAWEPGIVDHSADLSPNPDSILGLREGHWRGARAARFVPKAKAARAYKDTVRQQVDPALMEWAGAGVFQARVFPLLPGATHRVNTESHQLPPFSHAG